MNYFVHELCLPSSLKNILNLSGGWRKDQEREGEDGDQGLLLGMMIAIYIVL